MRFRVGRAGKSHHVARVLDDQMLEAATSADERNVVFARVLNSPERSLQASIRATGAAEQSLKLPEIMRLIGRQPHRFDWLTQRLRRVLNAARGRNMGGIVAVVVTNDADSDASGDDHGIYRTGWA